MRDSILYIAMSLDGFIAATNGGVDWLRGQDPDNLDRGGYDAFIKTVDTVVMGYNTYRQIVTELSPGNWPYPGLRSYVMTHKEIEATDETVFTDKPLVRLIDELKAEDGKNIWILGGASIARQLIKENRIDQYHIAIIPTILGAGISLFDSGNDAIDLQLVDCNTSNGMVELQYIKR